MAELDEILITQGEELKPEENSTGSKDKHTLWTGLCNAVSRSVLLVQLIRGIVQGYLMTWGSVR